MRMLSTYESGPLQGGRLVLRIQSLTPDHSLFHQEHLEYGVNPDPFPLLPVRVVKFYQGLQKKQELSVDTQNKRFIHSTNIKNKAPPLHTSMEVISYHANNDNYRHIKFVIHYTVSNVYPWFCVNCIQ